MAKRQSHELINVSESFESARSDYAATKRSRFRRVRTGLNPMGSSADYHYRVESEFLRLLEDARDMDRNDVIVGQTINRAIDNQIQAGMTLDPQTGSPDLDDELSARFKEWSEDPDLCDVTGEMTFHQIEKLVGRSMLSDGDVFGLPLEGGTLQMVEAHRCRTPRLTKRNVVMGVLLDEYRRRREYWFTNDDIDPSRPLVRVGDITPYPARDGDGNRQVFHCYNPKRFTQTRGISALAPIFDVCGMFEDIQFAKMVQQQLVSCFVIFRKRERDFQPPGDDDQQAGERQRNTRQDGSTELIEGVGPGMQINGRPGEELQGFSPNVPNAEFFQHVRLILTLVGINLGLPLVLVTLDASETNYSGFRGAVDQARIGFRENQRQLITRFHCPVYRWKVRQWIAEDRIIAAAAKELGPKIFAHEWNAPTWGYIDPMKDASADLLRLRNGLVSRRRLRAENGYDSYKLDEEIVEDNAYAIRTAKRAAVAINAEFPDDDPVHWRELLSLPTPDGINLTMDTSGKDQAAAKPQTPGGQDAGN